MGHAVDGVSHTLRWHGKAAWVSPRISSIPPRPGTRGAISRVSGGIFFLALTLSRASFIQRSSRKLRRVRGAALLSRDHRKEKKESIRISNALAVARIISKA